MKSSEHLKWCKARALRHINRGDLINVWTLMVNDLRKHEGTRDHSGIELGTMLLMSGNLSTDQEMKRFIEGFN